MAKKCNISYTVTKLLLSAAFIQLLTVCFFIIPPEGIGSTLFSPTLRPYIPEMTQYAALTAALSCPIGILCEKIFKK